MTEIDPSAFGAIGLLMTAILAIVFVLYFVPVPLWIAAWSSGAYVELFTLIGMRLRRVRFFGKGTGADCQCCIHSRR